MRGGWSVDVDWEDPISGRRYDLRCRKDQKEVARLVRRDKPEMLWGQLPAGLVGRTKT